MISNKLLEKMLKITNSANIYRNEIGELPISREVIGADEIKNKWLVEYKFSTEGGYTMHRVWEDMKLLAGNVSES